MHDRRRQKTKRSSPQFLMQEIMFESLSLLSAAQMRSVAKGSASRRVHYVTYLKLLDFGLAKAKHISHDYRYYITVHHHACREYTY
jgi:hypothetical protein